MGGMKRSVWADMYYIWTKGEKKGIIKEICRTILYKK